MYDEKEWKEAECPVLLTFREDYSTLSEVYQKRTTMTEASAQVLKSAQCARIIACISEMFHVPLQDATDIYYESETANLIEEGVADLHCRSDKYLATEVWMEHLQG